MRNEDSILLGLKGKVLRTIGTINKPAVCQFIFDKFVWHGVNEKGGYIICVRSQRPAYYRVPGRQAFGLLLIVTVMLSKS